MKQIYTVFMTCLLLAAFSKKKHFEHQKESSVLHSRTIMAKKENIGLKNF
jgi:hypothetical protein